MLVLLPILVFISLFINVKGIGQKERDNYSGWRRSFLISAIIWAALAVVFIEGLSLLTEISPQSVAILWAAALVSSIGFGIRRRTFSRMLTQPLFPRIQLSPFDLALLLGLALILFALGILAWVSPPNNIDALAYHMPRIAHWIQHSSLRHYPTAYQPQLWNPPAAEIFIMNIWILWGSDQPANMIQWFSLAACLVAISAIAGLMGAKPRGQLIAVAFGISIPMGILQSTSAQTDLVTAFWLVSAIYFTTLSTKRELTRLEWITFTLATGLGALTKGTFYAFALPILLWFFIPHIVQRDVRKTLLLGASFLASALVLNLGFWVRNIITYAGPLGPPEWLEQHSMLRLNPALWLSGIVTKIALHFPTPWEEVNTIIDSAVGKLHHLLGLELSEFNLIWAWNHEDSAGNPLHLLALLLAGYLLINQRTQKRNRLAISYTFVVAASFLLHASLVRTDPFAARYQLPFFIIGAPLVGIAFSQGKSNRMSAFTGLVFLLAALPWLLFNSARPIIGMRPRPEPLSLPCIAGCTRTGSVFSRPPSDILFANWPEVQEYVTAASDATRATGCQKIGLRIDSHDDEYLFWWLLDAYQIGTQIETIYTFPSLQRYVDPTYKPCAIICTICRDRDRAHGLDRTATFGYISIYAGSDFIEALDD